MSKFIIKDHPKVKHHMYLDEYFKCFDGYLESLDWIIVHPEFNSSPSGISAPWKNFYEMSGEILRKKFVDLNSPPQIIWGSFLGFKKGEKPKLAEVSDQLFSEGRDESDNIQHPKAIIEINCVDSGWTEIYLKDERLIKIFSDYWHI